MNPSRELLYGTVSVLARCGEHSTFYWLPSTSDFPGVDGVLADSANVFAVQATIASEHRDPWEGLRKVWQNFDRRVRDQRAWHVVFVTDSKALAQKYADQFEAGKSFTLGRKQVKVEIWSCVLQAR